MKTEPQVPLDLKDWVVILQRKDEDCPRMTSRIASAAVADMQAEALKKEGHRVIATCTVESLLRSLGVSGIPEMEGR